MKRLTINHVAQAAIRSDKRACMSLAAGIFLSVFLVTAIFMSGWGVHLVMEEDTARTKGRQDFVLTDCDMTDERLMSAGHFDELGHVYITAFIDDSGVTAGYYDEAADRLLVRQVVEGRMPEKSGEIALERSVLESMRRTEGVGDEIEFRMTPPGGAPEERTFTIVGILDERTNSWGLGYRQEEIPFPAALVSPEESAYATGRTAVNRVMTIKGGTVESVLRYWTELEDGALGNLFGYLTGFDSYGYAEEYWMNWLPDYYWLSVLVTPTTLMVVFIGIALLIASGVGISQAMESRLTQRTEQIGMLRAVGATKRQIRRIFGRETWILAAALMPFSLAAGCGFAWVLSRALPGRVIFSVEWRLLAPVALISAVTILLSARLPLRRASAAAPMGVLRDMQLMRRAQRIRGKSSFRPARLIAGRQLKLYPSRQIGAAVLVAVMLVCVMLAVTLGSVEAGKYYKDREEFRMYSHTPPNDLNNWDYGLTDSDLAQLRALPEVTFVSPRRDYEDSTYLVVDQPGEYLKPVLSTENLHLCGDEIPQTLLSYLDQAGWDNAEQMLRDETAEHEAAVQALGISGSLVSFRMQSTTITEEQAEALRPYVVEGEIDIEAINAGREVLVLAAPEYVYYNTKMGWYSSFSSRRNEPGYEFIAARENDFFHAGQKLDILQINGELSTEYGMGAHMADADPQHIGVTVGAVLTQDDYQVCNILAIGMDQSIITTEQGAGKLGLYRGWLQEIGIYLSDDLDREMEEYLEERVYAIGMRAGGGYVLNNNIATARSEQEGKNQLVAAFLSMAVVFLASAVGMVAGNMRRRVMADKRMIGTLRAVGADMRVLMRSYAMQMSAGILAGLGLGLIIMCIAVPAMGSMMYGYSGSVVLAAAAMIAFAGLCFAVCSISLRVTLAGVMKRSIVENIREL